MKKTLMLLLCFFVTSAFAAVTLIIDGVVVFQTGQAQAVDGVCGASNGGTFSAAPRTGLCSVGGASVVSGTAAFGWVCAGSGGGAQAKCTASLATPPTTSCGAGEVMGVGDLVWSSFNVVQLWPIPAVTGSGAAGRTVQFVADSSRYPRGVQLILADENQFGYGPKDYVVSQCPHSFAAVGNKASCTAIGVGSYGGPIYLRFGPAQPGTQSYDCPLTAGGTYYINFRDYYPAYDTVSSQFVLYNRTD